MKNIIKKWLGIDKVANVNFVKYCELNSERVEKWQIQELKDDIKYIRVKISSIDRKIGDEFKTEDGICVSGVYERLFHLAKILGVEYVEENNKGYRKIKK